MGHIIWVEKSKIILSLFKKECRRYLSYKTHSEYLYEIEYDKIKKNWITSYGNMRIQD